MATASHLHLPMDAIALSGPSGVTTALTVLEGTLSKIASQTAIAAESLHDDRSARASVSDTEVATWWLDRLVRAALTTRDTCRAARAAIDRGAASGREDRSRSPRAASPEMWSHRIFPERQHADRWIVVGYDSSEAAERALLRAADAAGERDAIVIVATKSQVYSGGAAAEALLEPSADPSDLLAAAKATITARTSLADVVVVAREGDPAEELLEVARAASADLLIVGRRGKDFVARMLLGSVAARVVEQAPCDVLVVA
jgi:nucleotide-binding universal stress UspA family protein